MYSVTDLFGKDCPTKKPTRYGLSTDNIIYYPHTNTLSFNWNGYGEKITQEEFDDFVNKVDRSKLPEDIRFELK